jgi:ubiquinone/menaquinone biosynthesis C-methylase UbiE
VKAKQVFSGVFSRHARAYQERVTGPVRRREAKGRLLVIELLGVSPGERVLDVACGPGTVTFPLAEAVGGQGLVVGTDLAEGMLRLARQQAPPNVGLAVMDAEELAFPAGSFDAVACAHGLQFCPDLSRALAEVARVLRKGGRFAASFPASSADRHARRLLDEVFAGLPPPPDVPDRVATLETLKDAGRTRQAARRAGFVKVEVRHVAEVITYSGPEDLVSRTFGWWDCA